MSDIFDAPGIPHVGHAGVTLVDIQRRTCIQNSECRPFSMEESGALDRWIHKQAVAIRRHHYPDALVRPPTFKAPR